MIMLIETFRDLKVVVSKIPLLNKNCQSELQNLAELTRGIRPTKIYLIMQLDEHRNLLMHQPPLTVGYLTQSKEATYISIN